MLLLKDQICFWLSRGSSGFYSEGACVYRICLFVAETGKFSSGDFGEDNLMNAVQRIELHLFLPVVLLIDSGQVTCTNFSWVVTNDVILSFWLTQLRYSEVLRTHSCSKSQ